MVACNYQQLQQTLRAAGAPSRAVNVIPAVINACQACRHWKKPPPHSTLSITFDWLFYNSLLEPTRDARPIIHLIDTCLRWSATQDCGRKTIKILLDRISAIWISIHGPMKVLTMDQESSMRGKCVDDLAIAKQITLHYKAPRQKAWLVERHNEILRQALHKVETQIQRESLVCSFTIVLHWQPSCTTRLLSSMTLFHTTRYMGDSRRWFHHLKEVLSRKRIMMAESDALTLREYMILMQDVNATWPEFVKLLLQLLSR